MQKKLIALAIAGLASSAAFAQSNVTVYGLLDYGYVNRSGQDGASVDSGTRTEFASGVSAGSRLGFKGAEDIGNGLKAIFELEYGLSIDNGPKNSANGGSAPFWNRHSYVGLTGGFGTFVGGRVDGDRYTVFNTYDPFGGGTVANAANTSNAGYWNGRGYTQVSRGDNAIAYISPDLSGFKILAFYTTKLVGNENGTLTATPQQNTGDLRGEGLNVTYTNGPIGATANYETFKTKNLNSGDSGFADVNLYELAASYDFGVVKVSALYDRYKSKDTANGDTSNWFVGASAPIGNGLVRAVYSKHTDKLNENYDCKKFGIGYKYNLSKRTNVYTDYARIKNDSLANCQVTVSAAIGAADYSGTNAGVEGYGTRGLDIGIQHAF
jgi:predicted porin